MYPLNKNDLPVGVVGGGWGFRGGFGGGQISVVSGMIRSIILTFLHVFIVEEK